MTLRNSNSKGDGKRHDSTESGRSTDTVRGPFASFAHRGTTMKVDTKKKHLYVSFIFLLPLCLFGEVIGAMLRCVLLPLSAGMRSESPVFSSTCYERSPPRELV